MRSHGLLWMALAALAACGTSSADADAGADTYVGCVGDPRLNLQAFPGVVTTDAAGGLQLRFLSADPSVPLSGENTWTVAVEQAGGQNAPAGTVVALAGAAFMPDHGHPSSVTPTATLQADGTWKIENIYLTMAGVWRLTLTLKLASGPDQTAVVFVCVTG